MNVGEYGITFNMNVNFNISGFTTLSLAFTRPDGSTFTRTNSGSIVTVGGSPLVTTDLGTFAANEYCIYVFQSGDLTLEGTYSARLTYTDASKRLVSDATSFTVNP